MKITQLWTAGKTASACFTWVPRSSKIVAADGRVIFAMDNIMVPDHWGQLAVDMLAQKYLRKAGVPSLTSQTLEDGVPAWLSPKAPSKDAVFGSETSAAQVFHRLAGCWTYWGWDGGYFSTENDATHFYNEIFYMLANQMAAPNSPQFFNVGLWWAYGIAGEPSGFWRYDEKLKKTVETPNSYQYPSGMACFISSVKDDLLNPGGIMPHWVNEAKIFKHGAGAGSNYSELRGTGEPLSGGGKASGLISWLKIGDVTGGSIKSGGTVRRAAKIDILDLDHPDIEEFINWKVKEEDKVAALVVGAARLQFHADRIMKTYWDIADESKGSILHKQILTFDTFKDAVKHARLERVPGPFIERIILLAKQDYREVLIESYTTDYEGQAYQSVTAQNSNNSVRATNAFMEAVDQDLDWHLFWRTELRKAASEKRQPKPCKTIKARSLWEQICYAAWSCADPGIQFDTTIQEWHTCSTAGRIKGANPCSEYLFIDDTACNLASLNLLSFYDPATNAFDVEAFKHAARLWTMVLEITVHMGQFPTAAIAENTWRYRTIGLGFANLGALLMVQGLPYDSEAGRAFAGAIAALLHFSAGTASAEMAEEMGPFPGYPENAESMQRVFRNHLRAASKLDQNHAYEGLTIKPQRLDHSILPSYLSDAVVKSATEMYHLGKKYGYRNAQLTNIAPTGTIALLMGCETTGCEPDFSLVKFKVLAGGGVLKIVNQAIPDALFQMGYSNKQIMDIKTYIAGTGRLESAPKDFIDRLEQAGVVLQTFQDRLATAIDLKFLIPTNFVWNSPKEQDQLNTLLCGTGTIEGAPHIQPHHLPSFDCAVRCGRTGKRSISPEGHVLMLGALQPFISGSISKTINFDSDCSIIDISSVYMLSHEHMVKAAAAYRNGSKLSQPLMGSWYDEEEEEVPVAKKVGPGSGEPVQKESQVGAVNRVVEQMIMGSSRRKLPSRRKGYTQKMRIGGHAIYVRTGEYPDGTLGEIFLDFHREGEAFRSVAHCLAIAVSLGLQYGVPLDEFVDAFAFTRFAPNGVVSGHAKIKMASSIVDAVFRDLAITYLGRHDLAQVMAEDVATTIGTEDPEVCLGPSADTDVNGDTSYGAEYVASDRPQWKAKAREVSISEGFTGDPCATCGQLTMVRSGTCLTCRNCGATSGGC